jgi:hypothetical protein
MTINVANLDITTDSFGTWVVKTNTLAHLTTNHTVTVDTTAFGNNSTGNGTVIGRFGANTLFAINGLRGGDVVVSNTLVISSNLSVANTSTFVGNVTFSNTITVAGLGTFTTNVTSNGFTSNTAAIGNVSVNTTAISIVGTTATITAIANSTVARLTIGNSTVNATHLSSNNGYFSGNLVVDGVFTTTSDLNVAGDLIPPVTNTYDFGNTTSTFRTGYFNLVDTTDIDASNSVVIGTTTVNSSTLQSSSLFTINTTANTVGAARFANTVTVIGNTTLSNTLAVTGAVTLSNTLNVSGLSTFSNITGATVNATAINVGANINVTTTSISIGNSTVNTFANSTALDIDGTLAVLNSVSFSNTLSVTGLSTLGPVNATTANTTALNVGANVALTTTQISVGNTTANITISNSSINVNGATVNSTVYSGTANNSTNLNGQLATFYTNATNLATGTVPTARLGSGTANSTTFLRGDQSYVTAVTSVAGGNGLTGTVTTAGSLAVNANNGIVANSFGVFADARTGLVANTTGLHVNASYIATISANNTSFFNGQAAAFYTNASNISTGTLPTGRLTGTYSISINGNAATATDALNANNAGNLNGQAASFYTNIPARLGYTPASRGGDTFTGGVVATHFVVNTNQFYYMRSDGAVSMYWDGTSIVLNQQVYTPGNIVSSGNIIAYASDKRLKANLRPISQTPLSDLLKLNGVRFEWREDTGQPMRGTDVGLLAQDVEAVLPEAVTGAPFDNTYKTIKMNQQVTALMIEAIKELKSEVDSLRAEVRRLKEV